jgi:PAS domain S-box-containing protein
VHQIELELQNEALREAQKALEESRNEYLDLYESSPVGYLTLEETGQIAKVNLTAARLLGLERGRLLNQRFDNLVDRADRQKWRQHFSDALIDQERRPVDLTLKRGVEPPVKVRLDCLRMGREGTAPTLRIALTDLSERERSEDILRHTQAQLKLFIQHAPISIAMFDLDMNYLATSGRWLKEYARGCPDLTGRNHYTVHPDLPEEWKHDYRQGLNGIASAKEEDRWVLADGSEQWLRWSIEPWTNQNGVIGGIVIATENITERKQAETLLQRSEQRLALALEASSEGLWDWDLRSGTVFRSARYYEIVGCRPEEGTPDFAFFQRIVHPDDLAHALNTIETHRYGKTPGIDFDFRLRESHGEQHWMAVKGRVVERDATGVPLRIVGTLADITDRKRIESALRQSEAFKDAILNAVTAHIAVIDSNGVIMAVNEPWQKFAQDNRRDLFSSAQWTDVGVNYLSMLQTSSGETAIDTLAVYTGIEAVLERRLPIYTVEYPCHIPERKLWFTMSVTPLEGQIRGAVIAHVDITERKLSEEKVSEQQQILETLLACIPEGITIVRMPDLVTTHTSRYATERLLNGHEVAAQGLSIDDWMGKVEHYLPDERTLAQPEDLPLWRAAVRGETVEECELTLRKPNGQWIPVTCHAAPMRNSAGDITGGVVAWHDITRRKAHQKALTLLQERLRIALRAAHAGIWDWNVHTGELAWSDEMFDLFGLEPTITPPTLELWRVIVHPEDLPLAEAQIENTKSSGEPHFNEYRIVRPSGEVRWIYSFGNLAASGADQNTQRLSGICIDITERKKIDGQLAAMSTEMQEILSWQVARHTVAAMAHELNQPLASIAALSTTIELLLNAQEVDSEKVHQLVQRMGLESQRAGNTVHDLMASLHKPNSTLEETSLFALMHQILRNDTSGSAGDYMISVDCPKTLPHVRINPQQVEKVFHNLIGNGIEAMKGAQVSKGKIWMTARLAPNETEVCISVRDKGPGITAAMATQLFHPFVSSKATGLGMGLAISRSLIEAQGGRLWLEPHDGRGAMFQFTLPVAR